MTTFKRLIFVFFISALVSGAGVLVGLKLMDENFQELGMLSVPLSLLLGLMGGLGHFYWTQKNSKTTVGIYSAAIALSVLASGFGALLAWWGFGFGSPN